jgi:nucleotide-binding universal stress UspA family protein
MKLFKRVLVPLDGSDLAECTLPYLKELASCQIVEGVVLLTVVDFGEGGVGRDTAKSGDTRAYAQDAGAGEELDLAYKDAVLQKAREYLATVRGQLASDGISAEVQVFEGKPAPGIVDYANEGDADLVLIATHGRTGLRRLLLGSVANQVLNEAHVPVLLIRPSSCR